MTDTSEPVAGVQRLIIRADGAARGNPGPAAAGAVLIDAALPGARSPDAAPLAVVARPLGNQTNNFAEYTAVVLALELAQRLGAEEVDLVLDSKLVVEQLHGRWRVRHPGLVGLHAEARRLLSGFRRWSARQEPRATNHAADALANLALDDPAAAAAAESARPGRHVPVGTMTEGDEAIGRATIGAACAIFDGDGRVLLVRHSYGRRNWELPGGTSLPDEPPDLTAARELAEETGLEMRDGRLAAVYFEPQHPRLGPLLHFVFLIPWTPEMKPSARPPEIDEVGFWPPEALPRPISDFTERRITDARREAVVYGVVASRAWRE